MHRVWLDWNKPCLPQVAWWLIQHGTGHAQQCDLRTFVCVVPGQRAGRILLELLVRDCQSDGLRLMPPRMVTPGVLAHALLRSDQPVAQPLEVQLTWMGTLQYAPADLLKLLVPQRPSLENWMVWFELAGTIRSLANELAGAQIDFQDVAEAAERREMFAEGDRWRALVNLADLYHHRLHDHGLRDPHEAQRQAIEAGVWESEQDVVLIAIPELNQQQRALLGGAQNRLTSLIHAPESWSGHFDDLGCPYPEMWNQHALQISDNQVNVVERWSDQAQAALNQIAALADTHSHGEITLGLGDELLGSTLQHHGNWAGIDFHAAAGESLLQSAPARFLSVLADWLEEPRFVNFAALLRHPDVEHWLQHDQTLASNDIARDIGDWLTLLDRYFSDHLHERLTGHWLGDSKQQKRLKLIWDAVQGLCKPLDSPQRAWGKWAQPILDVLNVIFCDFPETSAPLAPPAQRKTLDAIRSLSDLFSQAVEALEPLQPTVTTPTAIRMFLSCAGDITIPELAAKKHVEMLGWLELHLDVAPAMIITGCNDNHIPRTFGPDPFLPNTLREMLGLSSNQSRYGRDMYLLQVMVNSRENVALIAGRYDQEGSPLLPSRLLLTGDDETLINRTRLVCSSSDESARTIPRGAPHAGAATQFTIPDLPPDLPIPTSMSVTDFRAYLACPYRYALSRILKLESLTDDGLELDALQFGTLAHSVLEKFGSESDIKDSTEAEEIVDFLIDALKQTVNRRFGHKSPPAVQLQIARLEQRLEAFAHQQAKLRAEGWIIQHTEFSFSDTTSLDIPDQDPMTLRGKIDRLDQHEQTGAWRIIDYKTGDSGTSPHKAHHDKVKLDPASSIEWIDLQLPLYAYLAQQNGITGDISLGYLLLPKKTDNTALKIAEWTDEYIESAIEKAREVVRRIRAGDFMRNLLYDPRYEQFAHICHTTSFAEDSPGESFADTEVAE